MTGAWLKRGLLYSPPADGLHPRLKTHAANPCPVHMEGDVYRVLYNGRDDQNRSSIGAVDIDIVTRDVIHVHREPLFTPADEPGYFRDGVSIGNVYSVSGRRYLSFMGWHLLPDGRWRGEIGRLELCADFSLKALGHGPLLPCRGLEAVSLSYPWVIALPQSGYRMWYGSTVTWDAGNGEMVHPLHSAFSENGHDWTREGPAIEAGTGRAQAFGRPSVIQSQDGQFDMWVSFRGGGGDTYRIGHASSRDGKSWRWCGLQNGLMPSKDGWDSEMVEYPCVFDDGGKRYMLYCGNRFGRTGFGLAEWVNVDRETV